MRSRGVTVRWSTRTGRAIPCSLPKVFTQRQRALWRWAAMLRTVRVGMPGIAARQRRSGMRSTRYAVTRLFVPQAASRASCISGDRSTRLPPGQDASIRRLDELTTACYGDHPLPGAGQRSRKSRPSRRIVRTGGGMFRPHGGSSPQGGRELRRRGGTSPLFGEAVPGRGERFRRPGKRSRRWGECSNPAGECSGGLGECSNLKGECSNLKWECSTGLGECSTQIGKCSTQKGECLPRLGECST